MHVLYDAGYSDLAEASATGHHSYVFGGEEGSLDHALVPPALDERVTGFDIWEINAHEAFPLQYDANPAFYDAGPYRASDHNPEVVGLDTTDEAPASVDLQLLGINDFHGRLESPSTKPAPDGRKVGGAAQLAGLVDQLRATNPNTGFVSAGDNIGASTFVSAVDDDNPTIDALDAAGLDISAVGNHEFDKGFADLDGRVQDRADFSYLGANVYFGDGSGRALDPYFVQTIAGIDVGYVGVVTEQTPSLVNPDGIASLEFHDPVVEATSVAAELKDGNAANGEADVVVLLAHEGAAESTTEAADLVDDPVFGEFANISADVDVIFSGHTHQEYALELTKPGGGTRPVLQTGDYGEKLAKAAITVDTGTKDVTDASAELIEVVGYPENAAVALNSFLASGGDNFTVLGGGSNSVTTGDNDLTMLVDHFRANTPVTADTGERTSVEVPAPPPYAPCESWGELVTRQYRDVAGREPSLMEMAAWSAGLEEGPEPRSSWSSGC